MADRYPSILARFEAKIEYCPMSGCWLWSAGLDGKGYPVFWLDRKNEIATRLAWRFYRSEPGSMMVLHKCDTPPCVNPDHLFLGTAEDNMRDMVSKGRDWDHKGDKCPVSKLTEDQVRMIRSRASFGESDHALSVEYNVSRSAIFKIRHRIHWRHI